MEYQNDSFDTWYNLEPGFQTIVVAVRTSEIKGGFIQEVAVKKETGQLKRWKGIIPVMQTTAIWKLLTILSVTTEKQLDRTKKCCYLARKTTNKKKIVHSCPVYHWHYKQNTAIWIPLTLSMWRRRHSFASKTMNKKLIPQVL